MIFVHHSWQVKKATLSLFFLAVLLAGGTAAVRGQTPTPTCGPAIQAFEAITTLPGAGWVQINNSQPGPGASNWFQGNPAPFVSQSGSPNSYVAANYGNGTGISTLSNWLLTPPVTLQNGAAMTFYTRTVDAPAYPDRLQVRMSTSGASMNVGTTATSVGDFTTLLLDINPTYTLTGYPSAWTQFTVTVSGLVSPATGRLAFRYFVENGGPSGINSDYIAIDTVQYDCNVPSTTLRILPSNPRYLTTDGVTAIYLTGAHTWTDVQDFNGYSDYTSFLTHAGSYGYNFVRLWIAEHTADNDAGEPKQINPHPWLRTGPGNANDGGQKFDLDQFNQAYFDRLRNQCIAAGNQGIYVSVMLFDGWSTDEPGTWNHHPFNASNNINGVNGTVGGYPLGTGTHTLANATITARQVAYLRKVVDTVNDLDNVIYEVVNESPVGIDWQNYVADSIRSYESAKPKQHLVGMNVGGFAGIDNNTLMASRADYISPANTTSGQDYKNDPPVATGQKVIFNDTDHIFAVGGDRVWVWKSFVRGLNVLYMDPYLFHGIPSISGNEGARLAMADTLSYANQVNLAAMHPSTNACSTNYCLSNLGVEYLVYNPGSGNVIVNNLPAGTYKYHWFDTVARTTSTIYQQTVGTSGPFSPSNGPTGSNGNVLYVERITVTAPPTPTPTPIPLAAFVKAINMNGEAVTIDGRTWTSYDEAAASGFSAPGPIYYTSVTFTPIVDSATHSMLNEGIWCPVCDVNFSQTLSNGNYFVYLWAVENHASNYRSYNVTLEGAQVASALGSLPNHTWARYGPYGVTVSDGTLNVKLARVTGDPLVTGVEIWSQVTPTPTPSGTATPMPTATPTPSPLGAPRPTATPTQINISGAISYCSHPVSGPVPNVTLTVSGNASGSTLSGVSGDYTLASLAPGGSYTVVPSKAGLTPGSAGSAAIDTRDVIATQQGFFHPFPPGSCSQRAADVNSDGVVNTIDVVAVQHFFLRRTFGYGNVGKYRFTPANRSYSGIINSQIGQNFDAVVLGDVAPEFLHGPEGPSHAMGGDGTSSGEVPASVATLSLPNAAIDPFVTGVIVPVTTTDINETDKLVGFQGDFTFDERVVTFQSELVQKAGLTGGNWNVSGNVLPEAGPIRTLRISAFSNDFTPLSGSGTLFELRMTRLSKAAEATKLIWAEPPNHFIFIDGDFKTQKPGNAPPGSVTTPVSSVGRGR